MKKGCKESLVTKKLKKIIREQSNYEGDIEFEREDFTFEQIDFDSIKFVELIVVIEDEFHIEFNDEDLLLEKIISFKELNKLLHKYVDTIEL